MTRTKNMLMAIRGNRRKSLAAGEAAVADRAGSGPARSATDDASNWGLSSMAA
jgi:hypothetical protein